MTKFLVIVSFFILSSCLPGEKNKKSLSSIPIEILGNFTDDYNITYTISNKLWVQHPGIKYHLISYDTDGQFFLARNDADNPNDKDLYTRIDITHFENMLPWNWGFCLTVYNAKTLEEAASAATADRKNPKKGCGGFPFSRMKRLE